MSMRVCVVTGSRADYGLLYWVLHDLRATAGIELQIVVTGMHLTPEFGSTVSEIEQDGFAVTRRVDMLLASDTPNGTAKSLGLGVIGMSDALDQLRPDLLLVLGDRFEILAAVQAALIHNVPVAHIAGGDTTEGAFDESIRHAITKMAHVHLVTNEQSAERVRQLGEDPRRVHVVGSPGLDHLRRRRLLDRGELETALGTRLAARNLLVTFHPATLESATENERQLGELLAALDSLGTDTALWITGPNADPGGRTLAATFDVWALQRAGRARVYASLGHVRYLSLLAQVDAVIGNSSSGLYEAPSFGIATVNIGERQRGRLAAASVLHCAPERDAIGQAIAKALTLDCSAVVNPYGDGRSAQRIVAVLQELPAHAELLSKRFHTVGGGLG